MPGRQTEAEDEVKNPQISGCYHQSVPLTASLDGEIKANMLHSVWVRIGGVTLWTRVSKTMLSR